VHRTVGARPIAISCLGAFWTPADERVAAIVFTGIQKPAQKATSGNDSFQPAVEHKHFIRLAGG
jgi:hypothetical protein